MEDLSDLDFVNNKKEDGINVIQVYRPQSAGYNRKLSSEELGELFEAVKDGKIVKTAQKLRLNILSVNYWRHGDGFKVEVRV